MTLNPKVSPVLSALVMLMAFVSLHAKEANAPADFAALKHPVKPMLWKIEGKGIKKPSYLFGTIHVADKRVTTLHPLAQKAFDQSGAFYAEVDLSPAKQVAATKYFIRNDGKTLQEVVGDDIYKALDRELKVISPQLSAKALSSFKIWALGAMLPMLSDQLAGKKALDFQLWEKAKKKGKKTGCLETYAQQLGALDKLKLEDQIKLLDVTLQIMKKARDKKVLPYIKLLNAYLAGNVDEVSKQMNSVAFLGIEIDPALNERMLKLMLDSRNPGMVDSIVKAVSAPNAPATFFAAGAGHYVGKNSVVELLKAKGYKVTLVAP